MVRQLRIQLDDHLVIGFQLLGPCFSKEGLAMSEPGFDGDHLACVNRGNEVGEGCADVFKIQKVVLPDRHG